MKFSAKEAVDMITFTEEILSEKVHFLCGATFSIH